MNLEQWLSYQQQVHPLDMELGLNRVREVARRLEVLQPAKTVITVAGTNGKGSTVAMIDAMLRAVGHRVGRFMSPHVLRYNERVAVDGVDASDEMLVQAFEAIEQARAGTKLTYFEFGALAALWMFRAQRVDVALLEVGLGGRLDAVNIVDADVAVVTSIALDHRSWLGNSRAEIAGEKAGVFRAGRPAICGEARPPATLIEAARSVGAGLLCRGCDFHALRRRQTWTWVGPDQKLSRLPFPTLPGSHQLANAATAIMAVQSLPKALRPSADHVATGLRLASLPGRVERLSGKPEVWIDVAHNPAAVRALSRWMSKTRPSGTTHAIFSMLSDKDIPASVEAALGEIDHWHLAVLDDPRAADEAALTRAVREAAFTKTATIWPSVENAVAGVIPMLQSKDRLVAFGSFVTAGAVKSALRLLQTSA